MGREQNYVDSNGVAKGSLIEMTSRPIMDLGGHDYSPEQIRVWAQNSQLFSGYHILALGQPAISKALILRRKWTDERRKKRNQERISRPLTGLKCGELQRRIIESGIKKEIVQMRLARDWSIEEALGEKEVPAHTTLFPVHGQIYSIARAAQAFGLSATTLRNRLLSGEFPEDAVIPGRRTKQYPCLPWPGAYI